MTFKTKLFSFPESSELTSNVSVSLTTFLTDSMTVDQSSAALAWVKVPVIKAWMSASNF